MKSPISMNRRGKIILVGICFAIAVVYFSSIQNISTITDISRDANETQVSYSTTPQEPEVSRNIGDIITEPVNMCGSALTRQVRDKVRIFESVPVKSMALSQNNDALFVLNSPANCLEIYQITEDINNLQLISSISVGVDPVSLALRKDSEIWVVNHISDSVSIVSLEGKPHVRNTLQVGDAPWDIAFADNGINKGGRDNRRNRAFISASFRGQHHPQFRTKYLALNRLDKKESAGKEQIGRADLWVYDISSTGSAQFAGLINLFSDAVRSLTTNREGNLLFATVFKSGNRTAAVPIKFQEIIGEQWSSDGVGNPEPFQMVQQNGTKWLDEYGRDWETKMPVSIADNDVFAIDATSSIKKPDPKKPAFNRDSIISTVSDVGTVLLNGAFNDDKQHLIVAGIEARNIVTMEHKLKEDFVENRLTVIDFSNVKQPEKYFINLDDMANSDKKSTSGLAMPSAVDSHENRIYFTTLGGNKISHVVYDLTDGTPAIEKTRHYFVGKEVISPEPKGGPIGLLVSSKRDKLYVQKLFDHSIAEFAFNIDDGSLTETAQAQLYNPETPDIASGRQYLYDATLTSSKGNVSCATCHIFGEDDKLQWDLSRVNKPIEINQLPFVEHPDKDIPDLRTTARAINYKGDPNTLSEGDNIVLGGMDVRIVHIGTQKRFADKLASGEIDPKQSSIAYITKSEVDKRLLKYNIRNNQPTWVLIDTPFFHPLKGPMRTLPLKGMRQNGAMHFIGDIQGLKTQGNKKCAEGKTPEERAFKEFNTPCDGSKGTFHDLLGGSALPETAINELTAYSLALDYPPNPIRPLDNSTNENGRKLFFKRSLVDVGNLEYVIKREPRIFGCIDCHHIDRKKGLFGTSTEFYSAPALTLQDAKIPHLRFLYDRIGYFLDDYRNASYYRNIRKPEAYYDELITALGFNHGATFDSTMFFTSSVWVLDSSDQKREKPETLKMYEELFDFVMGFESDYYPMYGQQITYNTDELMEPEVRDNLLAFVSNAYRPKNTTTAQCNIYYTNGEHSNTMLFAPEVQASEIESNQLISKLSAIADRQAVTLTCL